MTLQTCDGWIPTRQVTPESATDVASALREAQEAGEAVIVVGKGLRLEQGNVPRAERALRMERLNRLIDYQPDDMTVTAEAGMTLAELQDILAARGQRLALDPAHPELTTLGGLVAANPDGPWRAAFGTVRDHLLGLTVASPDGSLFKSGSRVVKSVAGYDLPKLFTGSYGTLGVVTQVTLRVRPMPTASGAVLARWEDLSGLDEAWQTLRRAPLEPSFFELGVDAQGGFLAMGFEGESDAVLWQQEDVERQVHTDCERQTDRLRLDLAERAHAAASPLLVKVCVPPAEAIAFLKAAINDLGPGGTWLGHAGNGVLYGHFSGVEAAEAGHAKVEALRANATARRGHLVVLRAPRPWKEGWDVWGPTRSDFPLMKAVKQAFDPRGTLSPGRFVGGL
ncbi:putative FAD-linked oxidoreductase [compost metagenome]